MSSNFLRRFATPNVLKAIPAKHLLPLLQPHADYLATRQVAVPAPGSGSGLDYAALLEVLLTPDERTPGDLSDAFYLVHQLGTLEALEDLIDAAGEKGVDLEPTGGSPEDLVAQLRDRTVLHHVLAKRVARKRRQFDYYRGTGRGGAAWTTPAPDRLLALEGHLDGWFEEHGRGRGSKILTYARGSDTTFVVRHGQPVKRVGSLHAGKAAAFSYRPDKHDVVAYNPEADELAINAETMGEKALYQKAFGLHLFGSEEYFPGRGKYTLDPLKFHGADALVCSDVPGMVDVRLGELKYHWAGWSKEVVCRKADDLFQVFSERKRTVPQLARLVSAVFLVKFTDGKSPRHVQLLPSTVAEYARGDDAEIVETWLAKRGFIYPEAVAA